MDGSNQYDVSTSYNLAQRNLGPRIYGPQAHRVPRFYGEVRVFENNQEAYIQHQTQSKPES